MHQFAIKVCSSLISFKRLHLYIQNQTSTHSRRHSIYIQTLRYINTERKEPSMASLGVLNPRPTDFQKRFPPLPGLFPLPDFFELRNWAKTTNKYGSTIITVKNKTHIEIWSAEYTIKTLWVVWDKPSQSVTD